MKKINIVLLSLLSAFIIMSSGYGIWQKDLIIEGDLDVVADPEVIRGLELELQALESTLLVLESDLAEKLEEQRIQGELRIQEELRLIEEQKLLEVELKKQEKVDDIEDNNESEEVNPIVEANNKSDEEDMQNNEIVEPDITLVSETDDNEENITDTEDYSEATESIVGDSNN